MYVTHYFLVEQVQNIDDLHYINGSDLRALGMSKPQFRKLKRHLPSSASNTPVNNHHSMFTSTLGKLLVRVSTWIKHANDEHRY
jgi:hypothetical protein